MRQFLAIAVLLSFSLTAVAAGPWKVLYQDERLPTQEIFDHYTWVNPVIGATTLLKNNSALTNGSATTFTTFSAQPDFPRNIVLTPGGSVVNIGAGSAVITGTNIFGKSITESLSVSAGSGTALTGSSAFKSVSSIVFPASTGPGTTIYIGSGNKLGITRCLDHAGEYVFSELNGVYETTRGTMGVSASLVEANTFAPNGSMDGTKNVDLFYVQNFRCYGN